MEQETQIMKQLEFHEICQKEKLNTLLSDKRITKMKEDEKIIIR